ncbi:proton-coupled folate transporter-like [Asterias rubens]|uniref:proton-coupled folate transporter-like n=1 Tax=Asterias rubens TaxID=7604 RepID=UPI0014550EA9|nr:proton-coupled folate transporter-like [Asterias rubens]
MAEVGGFLGRHVAEVVLFLYMFGIVMQWPVTQLLILQKSCQGSHSEAVCSSLADHPEIQAKVQAQGTFWVMTLPSIIGIMLAFTSLLLGSASDKFGRGKILMLTCLGGGILALCFIAQSSLSYLSPTLLLIGYTAMGLSGSIGTFMATLFDYITDVTPADERTRRLSVVQPFAGLGTILGMLLSGIVLKYLGFMAVYLIFLATQTVVLFLAYKFMQVQPKSDESKTAGQSHWLSAVWDNLTAGARVCLKARPGSGRKHVIFMVLSGVITMAGVGGDMGLTVLYTQRAPFHWEPTTLGYFNAAKNVCMILGMVLGTRALLKVFGSKGSTDDLTLMQIGFMATAMASLATSMATGSLVLMLVPLLSILSGPSQAAGGAFSSKLIETTEKGAFSSFSSFIGNLARPFGTLVFSTIYAWTSTSSPGFAFAVQAAVYMVAFLLISLLKTDIKATHEKDNKTG